MGFYKIGLSAIWRVTTYRTVRIVAARRSVRSLLRLLALRCIAAQKRYLTVFALLTGYSPSARSARTHNLEGRGAQSRNSRKRKKKAQPQGLCFFSLVAEVGFEPHDLRVMSPTSCQTAPLRDIMVPEAGVEPVREINLTGF